MKIIFRKFNDISSKTAFCILTWLVICFLAFVSPCFYLEQYCNPNWLTLILDDNSDYSKRIALLQDHSLNSSEANEILSIIILKASKSLFENYHVLTLVSSISLLLITYFYSLKLMHNRLASLIAVSVVISSKIFFWYSIDLTYPNFFTTFLILSLYPFTGKSFLKPALFFVSVISKGISVLYLPIFLYTIKQETKRKTIMIYGLMTLVILSFVLTNNFIGSPLYIHWSNLFKIFEWMRNLRSDLFILTSLPAVISLLVYLYHKKIEHARFILSSIIYSIITSYILIIFTDYTDQQYRFLPFVIFYSLGISLITANRNLLIKDLKMILSKYH